MAFADGLHSGEGYTLMEKLGSYASRVSTNREIPVEVIATRAGGKEQLEMYRLLTQNVWAMIQEGFSEKVVKVGKTTSADLEWWFRDVMRWRVSYGFHGCNWVT